MHYKLSTPLNRLRIYCIKYHTANVQLDNMAINCHRTSKSKSPQYLNDTDILALQYLIINMIYITLAYCTVLVHV